VSRRLAATVFFFVLQNPNLTNMEFVKVVIWVHIAAGFTALVAGAVAILSQKGGKVHRSAGKVFYWAMTVVAATAIGVAAYKGTTFLLLIGIFSYYLTFTGERALRTKGQADGATAMDWGMFGLSVLTSGAMLVAGLLRWVPVPEAVAVFGGVLALHSASDWRYYRQPPERGKEWLYRHIRRMGAAYVATFTAFLVVNWQTNPVWLAWLLPTFIGTPLIAYTIRQYRKKATLGRG
jgi:uncharacterized membrane protein